MTATAPSSPRSKPMKLVVDSESSAGTSASRRHSSTRTSSGSSSKVLTHAEHRVRELFTAGVAGAESVIPLAHLGPSPKGIYSKISDHENDHEEDNDDDNAFTTGKASRKYHDSDDNASDNDDDVENFSSGTEISSAIDDDYDDNGKSRGGDDDIPDRSLCHMFGINAFAFAYGLIIATFGLITLPMESENLWPEKHAVLLAIFLVICGISQLSGPMAGFFSDRCTSIYGRRRPFLVIPGFIGVLSLFILQVASATKNLILYLSVFFIAMLSLNVMYVAYSGALTDLINEKQRGMANGLMGAFTVSGASAGFGCFSYFLDVHSGYYFYMFILSLSVFISMFTFTERQFVTQSTSNWTWKEIGESYWVDPVEHRDFFLVFVSRTFYYMGVSVQTFMLFYFRDVIGSDDPKADVSYLALLGQLSGAIFCVPMGLLSNRVGRKPLIYFSSGVIIFTYGMFMVFRTRFWVLLGGAIYGIGNGTYLSVDYALACDTIPSKDNAARYLGIWGVGAFIGTLLGPLIIGPTLLIFGDKGVTDKDGTPIYDEEGYVVILIIACMCLFAGAVTVVPVRSVK